MQLRARLLLPAGAPVQQEAAAEVEQLRTRLGALQTMRALAGWLEQLPQLGHDVFARGRPPSRAQSPEIFGVSVEASQALDVVEFLWASLAPGSVSSAKRLANCSSNRKTWAISLVAKAPMETPVIDPISRNSTSMPPMRLPRA